MSFLENVYQGILLTSLWEWIAVATGSIYVILAALRSNTCWSFAIASSGIYIYLCLDGKLYIESALQVFYVVMAIVGWITWRKNEQIDSDELDKLLDLPESKGEVKVWPISYHIFNILISGGVAFILGFCFDTFTDQANPYADAFTTVFSLAATFMIIKKILENWIYWIVIDIVSIFLYHERGYSLSAVLYFVFTILAVIGFVAWYRKYKSQSV
ncbi:MAG: nicotinamide mononucleotide transporter [Crocinitomicaceae bacterium]|nr:nicotinamide riboside transporter PnuC [Flavobacteriales bacterium]NQZ34967.1 nicotinamide mononucleotide transporter [Crocinitomicaceae bacterium]